MPTITCPDCGLELQTAREGGRPKLVFDTNDWSWRCWRLALGSPVWCLVHRDGTSARPTSNERLNPSLV
jgi:hypothetical protein